MSARLPLVPVRLLDPRAASEALLRPIRDAACIPLDQLAARTHELPPSAETIAVAADQALAAKTIALLAQLGRTGARTTDYEFDSDRGGAAATIPRLWRPTEFLESAARALHPGNALDLACGTGRDAVYLASLGWNVTAIDLLPDALTKADALARVCAPAIVPIQWRTLDLEAPSLDLDAPAFNLEAPALNFKTPTPALESPSLDLPQRSYDLVTCFRFLHRPLFARLASCVRPGGTLLLETFTTQHRARHGKPRSAAHVLKPGELPHLVSGVQVVAYDEAWRGEVHSARLHARRPVGAGGT